MFVFNELMLDCKMSAILRKLYKVDCTICKLARMSVLDWSVIVGSGSESCLGAAKLLPINLICSSNQTFARSWFCCILSISSLITSWSVMTCTKKEKGSISVHFIAESIVHFIAVGIYAKFSVFSLIMQTL